MLFTRYIQVFAPEKRFQTLPHLIVYDLYCVSLYCELFGIVHHRCQRLTFFLKKIKYLGVNGK